MIAVIRGSEGGAAVIPTTIEQYLHRFKSKSRILNRPEPDPRRPPRYFECVDFSLQGLERMIAERNEMYAFAKEAVRRASEEWQHFKKVQMLSKDSKPFSRFAEKLNYTKAKCLCFEAELRELNAMKQKFLADAEKTKKAVHRHANGVIKMKDGIPHLCDGRDLQRDTAGDVRFVDTQELLSDYLSKVAERKKAIAGAKKAKEAEVAAAVLAARGKRRVGR